MTNAERIRAYAKTNHQSAEFRPTGAQARRIRKAEKKARG